MFYCDNTVTYKKKKTDKIFVGVLGRKNFEEKKTISTHMRINPTKRLFERRLYDSVCLSQTIL